MARLVISNNNESNQSLSKLKAPRIYSLDYTVDEIKLAGVRALDMGVEKFSTKKSIGSQLKRIRKHFSDNSDDEINRLQLCILAYLYAYCYSNRYPESEIKIIEKSNYGATLVMAMRVDKEIDLLEFIVNMQYRSKYMPGLEREGSNLGSLLYGIDFDFNDFEDLDAIKFKYFEFQRRILGLN